MRIAGFVNPVLAAAVVAASTAAATAEELSELALWQLAGRAAVDNAYYSGQSMRKDHRDALLKEMIRRGGPEAEATLVDLLKKRPGELAQAKARLEHLDFTTQRDAYIRQRQLVDGLRNNLELVTALRRIQKKPDPVQIDVKLAVDVEELPPVFAGGWLVEAVELGPETWLKQTRDQFAKAGIKLDDRRILAMAGSVDDVLRLVPHATRVDQRRPLPVRMRKPPTFVVALRSADVGGIPIWLMSGADFFGDVRARWRFEVKDASGAALPPRKYLLTVGGGFGFSSFRDPGDVEYMELPLGAYVDLPKPGEYTVSILFHNDLYLADMESTDDLDTLIVVRSQPFKIKVE